jgi:hypothetical protein
MHLATAFLCAELGKGKQKLFASLWQIPAWLGPATVCGNWAGFFDDGKTNGRGGVEDLAVEQLTSFLSPMLYCNTKIPDDITLYSAGIASVAASLLFGGGGDGWVLEFPWMEMKFS